jgi:hypothetical protein
MRQKTIPARATAFATPYGFSYRLQIRQTSTAQSIQCSPRAIHDVFIQLIEFELIF